MKPDAYRALRVSLGSQAFVANLLGVSRFTVSNRERGRVGFPITQEAGLAIMYLRVLAAEALSGTQH